MVSWVGCRLHGHYPLPPHQPRVECDESQVAPVVLGVISVTETVVMDRQNYSRRELFNKICNHHTSKPSAIPGPHPCCSASQTMRTHSSGDSIPAAKNAISACEGASMCSMIRSCACGRAGVAMHPIVNLCSWSESIRYKVKLI